MLDLITKLFSAIPTPGWILLGLYIAVTLRNFNGRRKLLVDLPGPAAPSWITGHFRALFGFDATSYYHHLVSTYGSTVKLKGAFGGEFIWTHDPAALHSMLVKDRAVFERPSANLLIIRLVMGGGLISLIGDEHKAHRKLLNPVFNMKFLRELMPIFMSVAERACRGIENDVGSAVGSSKDINMYPWMTAGALELIGEAGLGYSFDSFSGKRNEYSLAIKNIVRFSVKFTPFAPLMPYLHKIGTPSLRKWVVEHLPSSDFQKLLSAIKIQTTQAEEVLRSRQALLSSGGDLASEVGRGRDILTLLMKANEAAGFDDHITHQDMVGHMNVFMFAGHETTSTAMSRIVNILADNEPIQTKLREEICHYFSEHKDDMNHDDLLELPYLDAVVREALRLYGPATMLVRESQDDTVIPLEYPVDTPSGKISSIPVKKGTRIISSVLMANRNPKIWGERASDFWPERWIENKLDEVTESGARLPGIYSSMMTFGGGPMSCIGFKFAVLEIKVMISSLVKTFRFEPSEYKIRWETAGIQTPYMSEMKNSERIAKLPIRVVKL